MYLKSIILFRVVKKIYFIYWIGYGLATACHEERSSNCQKPCLISGFGSIPSIVSNIGSSSSSGLPSDRFVLVVVLVTVVVFSLKIILFYNL